MKAIWNGKVIAESNNTILVDRNHYFPAESINRAFFKPSDHSSVCFWKGSARYFDIVLASNVNQASAWYYPDPSPAAANIKGMIAFWKRIKVE